jgi:hypothetical protein
MAEIFVVGASFLADDVDDLADVLDLDVEPRQLHPDNPSDYIWILGFLGLILSLALVSHTLSA